ncbi:hypothetical protein QR680_003211 [Steinernema hermaphroditum]|uniref:Uncharacterized protein n=1 Tax=Steinernema hermaphroditum TaxID=289476 RepID=A0AA39LJN3_9BILA|nr:hypothetical protein QR680_003211 [Steinernema hermaphroditum]
MGSASSTNVKNIQISQEESEKRPRSRQQRESSASSKRSITSAANERIRSIQSSLGSRSSLEKDGSSFYHGHTQAEATIGEDSQLRQLQKQQISALEMRNLELAEEVQWLRGQVCRVPQSIVEKPNNENYQQRCEELKKQVKLLKEEKAREQARYEATIRTVHTEALSQVREMHQKYELVERLNARLEDTVKDRLGASIVKLLREQMNQENRAKWDDFTRKRKESLNIVPEQVVAGVPEQHKRSSEPIITFLPTKSQPSPQQQVRALFGDSDMDEEEETEKEHKRNRDYDNVFISPGEANDKMQNGRNNALSEPPPYGRVISQINSE